MVAVVGIVFEDIQVQCCFTSTETVRTITDGQFEDVPLVEFMYLAFIRMPLALRVTVGDSALCCCVSVTSFPRVDSARRL